jgi:hypothetical protein
LLFFVCFDPAVANIDFLDCSSRGLNVLNALLANNLPGDKELLLLRQLVILLALV